MDRKTFEKQKPFAGEKKPSILGGKKGAETGGMKRAPQVLACSAHMKDKGILSQPAWP